MDGDLDSVDFFRNRQLMDDPHPYHDALRQESPVAREDHHGVTMVTGWSEAVAVYNDADTFSSCNSVSGPFPGLPIPHERLFDRTADIWISESHHGPAGDRHFQYLPTYILGGLTELQLEFDPLDRDR